MPYPRSYRYSRAHCCCIDQIGITLLCAKQQKKYEYSYEYYCCSSMYAKKRGRFQVSTCCRARSPLKLSPAYFSTCYICTCVGMICFFSVLQRQIFYSYEKRSGQLLPAFPRFHESSFLLVATPLLRVVTALL